MDADLINMGPSQYSGDIDLSIFESKPQSNNSSTKEILEQSLTSLLDQSIWDLPYIYQEKIASSISSLENFLKHNNYSNDLQISSNTLNILRSTAREYNYKQSLFRSMQKLWNKASASMEASSSSSLNPKIEQLISQYYSVFGKLLETLNEAFVNSLIKNPLFLPINSYETVFRDCMMDLKNSTTRKKLKMKLCPGVEPPKIKSVQRQYFRTIQKPFIEWNTFSIEKIIELEQEPSCVMVPFLHRLMNYTNQTKTEVACYTAPVGWEVTRISAAVTDGNYKEAIVTRTAARGEKGLVEVSVTYPKITKDHIWCKVSIEGIVSRKSVEELKVPEFKTVIVTVDEDGEHEIDPEFLQEVE